MSGVKGDKDFFGEIFDTDGNAICVVLAVVVAVFVACLALR